MDASCNPGFGILLFPTNSVSVENMRVTRKNGTCIAVEEITVHAMIKEQSDLDIGKKNNVYVAVERLLVLRRS